jgi:hypothetical protein
VRTSRPLCVRPGCTARGYHVEGCDTEDCQGCQPRLALDGLNLCQRDVEGIATDAARAAELRAALAKALSGSGQPGEKTSGTADKGLKINERAVEMRATIRHTLVSWSLLITEERGFSLPTKRVVQPLPRGFIGPPRLISVVDDSDRALADLIARSATWLAAHPAAGEAANELRDLVTQAHSIAYPSGTRVFEVAPCTEEGCGGMLKAVLRRTDSLLPSALVCDADENHTIPASEWLTLGRKLRRAA